MPDAKDLIYRFNGDPSTDDYETDLSGDSAVPEVGDIVQRRGREWRVVDVSVDYARAVVLYTIFLKGEFDKN